MDVRFIAVNDGVDSLVEGSNDFSPIRNWATSFTQRIPARRYVR